MFAILLLPWVCHSLSHMQLASKLPHECSVSIQITSGKPGAPSETIKVGKLGDTCQLIVRRHQGDKEVLSEAKVNLPREALEAVWQLVETDRLRAWLPQEQTPGQDDFGERRLAIQWKGPELSKAQVHEVAWTNPLSEKKQITNVFQQLKVLAEKHAGHITLHYFAGE